MNRIIVFLSPSSYRLQIFDNGSTSIDVQPIQRDPISFTGDMIFEK